MAKRYEFSAEEILEIEKARSAFKKYCNISLSKYLTDR